MISLQQGVALVVHALNTMDGGEIFIRKSPSMKVVDLARALQPDATLVRWELGQGEKIHEQMISKEEAPFTLEFEDHYRIYSPIFVDSSSLEEKGGQKVKEGFEYSSLSNKEWMSAEQLLSWTSQNRDKLIK